MKPVIEIPGSTKPWNIVFALAEEHISDSWMLVGGLMVQVHALMKGRDFRPTEDADFLVDLMSDHLGVTHLAHVLGRYGYEILPGTLSGYTTRMQKSTGEKVDLLVADHLPQWVERKRLARLGTGRMFSAPAGAQACERSMELELRDGDRAASIRIPDQLGALILKAAARMADKGPDRDRHLIDAAILCAIMDDPDKEHERLHSANDFRRLRALRDDIVDNQDYLQYLSMDDLAAARQAIEILAA